MNERAVIGCLLGTAVGDALGLPYEGLSPTRAKRLFRERSRYYFLGSIGMVSDDTELMCMTAQAIMVAGGNPGLFSKNLARRLRWWLLGLPVGVGWATLKAAIKMIIGFGPETSGIYSAGNAPAARSAIIGVCYGGDERRFTDFVKRATGITHKDPKAEYGALTVALAAHYSAQQKTVDGHLFMARLRGYLVDAGADEFIELIGQAVDSARMGEATTAFAASQGLGSGVSGYVYHTVPVAIQAWLRHPGDFGNALMAVIRCGGDTDTTGAIVGAIVGAGVGRQGIPIQWLDRLKEWPRTTAWIEDLANKLYRAVSGAYTGVPPRLPVWAVIIRNILFAGIVLFHGFRRLLPPY
jgi:ADP-ribosylglycohydrolase